MLNGRTALVVEEEFLIALDMQRMLEALGAGQMVFARIPAEAIAIVDHWRDSAVALIEWRPDDAASLDLMKQLEAARVPVVFIAAEAPGRAVFNGRPVLLKPVREPALASAIETALATVR